MARMTATGFGEADGHFHNENSRDGLLQEEGSEMVNLKKAKKKSKKVPG